MTAVQTAERPHWRLSHTRMEEISRPILDPLSGSIIGYAPSCTYRHQQLEYRGVKEMESDESLIGILMHVGAYDYGRYLVRRQKEIDQHWYRTNLEKRIREYELYDNEAEEARWIGERFAKAYRLNSQGQHLFEVRLAVDRDLQQCAPDAPCDNLAGSWDHLRIHPSGLKADLMDYKFGPNAKFYDDPFIARRSLQLQTYAAMAFWHFPQLEEVVGTLWGPRYGPNNTSTASFTRETVIPAVVERFNANLAILDNEFAEHGNNDWTARGSWSVCRWCKITGSCPKRKQYIEARS